jgi:hypothetical protein
VVVVFLSPGPPIRLSLVYGTQPTLINNVETFANIVPIIRNRGDWYASIGTEKSKGTKGILPGWECGQYGISRSTDGHSRYGKLSKRSAVVCPMVAR